MTDRPASLRPSSARRSSIAALEKDAAARLLTISLLTLFVGCAPSGANGPAAEVTDSSGVRIVTYDLTAVEAPALGAVGDHDLEIGVLEGPREYAFSRIVDLALLSDGSLVGVVTDDLDVPFIRRYPLLAPTGP